MNLQLIINVSMENVSMSRCIHGNNIHEHGKQHNECTT